MNKRLQSQGIIASPVVGEVCVVHRLVVVLAGPAVLAGADEDVGQQVDDVVVVEVQVAQLSFLLIATEIFLPQAVLLRKMFLYIRFIKACAD